MANMNHAAAAAENGAGALLPALEQAQKEHGYLSKDVLSAVADSLQLPLAEVAETASFYSLLTMEKLGQYAIHICNSAACHMAGSGTLKQALENALGISVGETTPDGKFTLLCCGCLGACEKSPAVLVNGRIYGPVKEEQIPALLAGLDSGVTE